MIIHWSIDWCDRFSANMWNEDYQNNIVDIGNGLVGAGARSVAYNPFPVGRPPSGAQRWYVNNACDHAKGMHGLCAVTFLKRCGIGLTSLATRNSFLDYRVINLESIYFRILFRRAIEMSTDPVLIFDWLVRNVVARVWIEDICWREKEEEEKHIVNLANCINCWLDGSFNIPVFRLFL